MNEMMIVLLSVMGLIAGFAISYFAGNRLTSAKVKDAENRGQNLIKEAEKEANNLKKEKLIEVKE